MKLSPDFVCRQVCGQTLLMPVGENTRQYNGVFTLTETGAFLLRAFLDGAPVPAAAGKLAAEYDVPPEEALADATAFADRLLELGVLTER